MIVFKEQIKYLGEFLVGLLLVRILPNDLKVTLLFLKKRKKRSLHIAALIHAVFPYKSKVNKFKSI
jgi:hypothetical protein